MEIATIADVAARLDPRKAQTTVARIMAVLGRELDWNSDTFGQPLRPKGRSL